MEDAERRRKMDEWFTLSQRSVQSVKPVRSLFGWKCPKCGSKLSKKSLKEIIVAFEESNDFVKRVVKERQLEPGGVYELTINHFICQCGYESAEADAQPTKSDSA